MRKSRSNRRKHLLLGAFIVFIMITSTLGYMFGRDTESEFKYNDYDFYRKGNLLATKVNGQEKYFHYFPAEIEHMGIENSAVQKVLSTPMLYSTYKPTQKYVESIAQAQYELSNELKSLNIYTVNGLTQENEYGLPVITCLNATASIPVINFIEANETEIAVENNCILVKAVSGNDFIKLKDRFVYSLLGIIK